MFSDVVNVVHLVVVFSRKITFDIRSMVEVKLEAASAVVHELVDITHFGLFVGTFLRIRRYGVSCF